MMKIDQPDQAGSTEPLSPGRRTFVKGIATVGAGIAAFPVVGEELKPKFRPHPTQAFPAGAAEPRMASSRGI